MKRVVVIGAGQLGSRHIQGLALSSLDLIIEVVDPSDEARKVAELRYNEVEKGTSKKEIYFYSSIEELSENIDIAIVATSSNVRCKIVVELLKTKKVNNLVLEKVLFQKVEEYYVVEKHLKESKTKCWVNHPRRMFPFYEKLKRELKEAKEIFYSFQGSNWGLGCNGLHFIDHLAYLVDSTEGLKLSNSSLNNGFYSSKRDGFIEFNGHLTGDILNHKFSLLSSKEELPYNLVISSDVLVIKISESTGDYEISKKENDWKVEYKQEKILYYQSELSNILVEDLLLNNKCKLPTYKEAIDLHVPFIKCLINHMKLTTNDYLDVCPIT